jgi:DNA-binding transcriptional ArsR family regulator
MIRVGSGTQPLRVTAEASPGYEFLLSLAAHLQPDLRSSPEQPPPVRPSSGKPSAAFAKAAAALGDHTGRAWLQLLPLVREPVLCHTVADLLERIEAIPPQRLRLILLGCFSECAARPDAAALVRAAAGGDTTAQRTLYRDPDYMDGKGRQLAPLFALTDRQTKTHAITLLRHWHTEAFAAREPELHPIMERDAQAKTALLATVTPERAIEIASGVEWCDMPGVSEVILVPQLALRPWVIFVQSGATGILCHPPAADSIGGDPSAPPAHMLRILKALSDQRRLRTLRAIPPEGATLQQLTKMLGWPKTTVHHHLMVLQSARLLKDTAERRYVPRLDIIAEATASLERYLRGDNGTPG